jgi:uncharacterized protein YraI
LPHNITLTAYERTADWFYVDYHGERGWISAAYAEPADGDCDGIPAPAQSSALLQPISTSPPVMQSVAGQPLPPSCMVTLLYALNFRAGPSETAEILKALPYNVVLTGVERLRGWIKVDWYGEKGWIAEDFVELSTGCRPAAPDPATPWAPPVKRITPVGYR